MRQTTKETKERLFNRYTFGYVYHQIRISSRTLAHAVERPGINEGAGLKLLSTQRLEKDKKKKQERRTNSVRARTRNYSARLFSVREPTGSQGHRTPGLLSGEKRKKRKKKKIREEERGRGGGEARREGRGERRNKKKWQTRCKYIRFTVKSTG